MLQGSDLWLDEQEIQEVLAFLEGPLLKELGNYST
jgi:hypothetical protein